MVNIVTVASSEGGEQRDYMVDVGFGSDGPSSPMLLREGVEIEDPRPLGMRLAYGPLPANEHSDSKLWRYEVRTEPHGKWTPMYCFTELEFLPQDYEVMNFWTSQSRKSWFTQTVVVMKRLMQGEEVVGSISLGSGEVKRTINGEEEAVEKYRNEKERVEVLREWFGIILTEDEERGIDGMATQLRGKN
ncbi:MAG: hypothetical protein Q9190_005164 [Brigantiaea leucoxantha]